MTDGNHVSQLLQRLARLGDASSAETITAAEFRELADAYIRLSSRFSKVLDISDKYQALIHSVERPRPDNPPTGAARHQHAPRESTRQKPDHLENELLERLRAHSDEEVRTLAGRYSRLQKQLAKIMSISDVYLSQLRETTLQLERMARTDMLTDLPNRRDMAERLTIESARSARGNRPYGVIVFDIDDFKAVNDTYGHDAGDIVLVAAAERFQSVLRVSDVCGRWGGEEFLVLCPESDVHQTMKVAEKCRGALESLVIPVVDGKTISLTVSGGVDAEDPRSPSPGDDTTRSWERIVNRADAAMYRAKSTGKNRILAAE